MKKRICEVCNHPMIRVPHVEYDGDMGSIEPYWECVTGCEENGMTQGAEHEHKGALKKGK